MKPYLIAALPLLLMQGAAHANPAAPATSAATAESGIALQNADTKVRIQDNFYMHVNGTWIKNTEIPADHSFWGAFDLLADSALPQLRGIIEDAAKGGASVPGSDATGAEAQKIGDLYASFMDEQKLEELGAKPLAPEFARVAALKSKADIPALLAHFNEVGIGTPYGPGVHLDNKDSTRYVIDFGQSGLGLPDRDYYLKDDAKLKNARVKYEEHIARMFTLLGNKDAKDAKKKARDILKLETELAKVNWTKVQNRDPLKLYNKEPIAKLNQLTPGYDWKPYLDAIGVSGKVDYVIVSQPSYMRGFAKLLKSTPLPVWKEYLDWQVLSSNASLLSKAFDEESFAFNGTVLQGTPQQLPRWKRGVNLEEGAVGEALGKLYVAKYFPPENKARVETLVGNLLAAFRQSVDTLDWMGPQTKEAAKAKLAAFTPKIGYPDKWRDYSSLSIARDDLYGNMERASVFEFKRNIDKLGKPVDRSEWGMTPQTVNAYYNPEMNEIVFPAAILQKPFFDPAADDAVNYGAIGAVIGHEISHGFDDQGAQYDGQGNLHDWWTADDKKNFKAKTEALVKQYSSYEPLPGYHVNGELTLGENIADNSGLAIAYKAYKISLGGKDAPVIDGLSGFQRFYMGYGQIWCEKEREDAMLMLIETNPHAPGAVRANGTVKNQPGFYEAFGVKAGDMMYLKPEDRVIIW
ncbi:MAG TPA: M13-type metalloendopeptidase [Burkholderiaceae bacterium]